MPYVVVDAKELGAAHGGAFPEADVRVVDAPTRDGREPAL